MNKGSSAVMTLVFPVSSTSFNVMFESGDAWSFATGVISSLTSMVRMSFVFPFSSMRRIMMTTVKLLGLV